MQEEVKGLKLAKMLCRRRAKADAREPQAQSVVGREIMQNQIKWYSRMQFQIPEEYWREIVPWMHKHRCRYRRKDGNQYFGVSGGGYEYSFTPTGLGTIYEIRCACGAKIEFDDL